MRVLTPLMCSVLLVLWMGTSRGVFAQTPETAPEETVRPGLLWLFDASMAQGYDDSPLGTGKGGYFSEFNPIFELEEDRQHGFWSLNLQPMVQHFYGFPVADHVNELASTTDSWRISRRWRLDLDGNYVHTSDPFFRGEGSSDAQPVGTAGVVAPNNAFVGPEYPFTGFSGSGTIDYQVGRHTQLTFGGDYFTYREDIQGLSNSTSYAFRAGYTKMVRRGQTVGLLYSSQSFTVTDPGEQATVNGLLTSYDFEWKTGRQVEFFAGPQYSQVNVTLTGLGGPTPAPVQANQDVLGYAAGATFSLLITKQNYLQLMISRRIANGAAASGVMIQDEAQVGLSRQFSKRLSASITGFYSEYQQLGNLPVGLPNGWGAFNRAQFMIAPRSAISIEYDYVHQSQISRALAPLFSDNRVLVGYHYSFGSLHGRR